jgi:hypothetical protein
MEHRWGERMAVDVPIRLGATVFSAKRGRLVNLSLSGGFIKTNLNLRVLSRLEVVIEAPRRVKRDAVMVAAYVARKTDEGIGVEWCEFAPQVVGELIREEKQRLNGILSAEARLGEPVEAARAAVATGRRVNRGR